MTNQIDIKARRCSYSVEFLDSIENLELTLKSMKYDAILFDKKLLSLNILSGRILNSKPALGLDAVEESKNFTAINKVLLWFSENSLNRSSVILVIGGGIVQDVATFACSIFHRGINWIYVPTTLLAQSDSSIGGKCGINLENRKNQVGVVYPPNRILNVHEFLDTLPANHVKSGIGEILKLSLTDDGQFWVQMKEFLDSKGNDFNQIVKLALTAKKLVIEIDEFEENYRRVLNYGHTFGHAFESASNYKIPHGFAVLFGMKIVNYLGVAWGESDSKLVREVDSYIDKILEESDYIKLVAKKDVFDIIKSDKKAKEGQITLVLLKELGRLKFVTKKLDSNLKLEILDAIDAL
jgi:3-dehydroquinate synthase